MDAIPEFTRDLLVSLHPHHAFNILTGKKTVELRRRFPEQHTRGALVLIYSTAPQRRGRLRLEGCRDRARVPI
jgi:predicted transcriptional regulator